MTTETLLLQSLRNRDEDAFIALVEQYHLSLVRLAQLFVQDESIAEELAQETWLAVLQGLERFEGRSSLKTWIFAILTNKAKSRSKRDNRMVTYNSMDDIYLSQPTVDPERFNDASAKEWPNHWAIPPDTWANYPEELLLSQETMDLIHRTIDALPQNQRAVITLRDMHELPSADVCNILDISETNQRVLLHRARARVRQALENYLKLET